MAASDFLISDCYIAYLSFLMTYKSQFHPFNHEKHLPYYQHGLRDDDNSR